MIELYREYLSDASFLYDQRQALLADPEVAWSDVDSFDERLEACLDGLVVGGELAIEVCKDRLETGDPGEAFAAIRVICRQGLRETVLAIAGKLTVDELERLSGIVDGLKHDCPETWLNDLAGMDLSDAQLILFARVAGYRRWKRAAARLAAALPSASLAAVPDVLWAMGRTGTAQMKNALVPRLRDPDERIRVRAADGLLALGDPSIGNLCDASAAGEPWAPRIGAVAGGSAARAVLQAIAVSRNSSSEAIVALGMLGDAKTVPVLIDLLARGVHPDACAQALDLIVGAGVRETVFVPEPAVADEDGATSAPQLRPDGKPYGSTVNRLSLNPEQWRKRWDECAHNFKPNVRYRLGQFWSPETVLSTIEAPCTPARIRVWSANELHLHFGYEWPFEIEMPVKEQLGLLAAARSWVTANAGRFPSQHQLS
ncbi:MAG: hypothetical protein ABMA01_02480 [Chthoniobacteraceae bacterium]